MNILEDVTNDMDCDCPSKEHCNKSVFISFLCPAQWNVKYKFNTGEILNEDVGYWEEIFARGLLLENEIMKSPLVAIYINGKGKKSKKPIMHWKDEIHNEDFYHEELVDIWLHGHKYNFRQLAVLEQI